MKFLSEISWQQKPENPKKTRKNPKSSIFEPDPTRTRPEPEKTRPDPKKPDPIETSTTDCPWCSQEYDRRIFNLSKLLWEHDSIENFFHLKKKFTSISAAS